MANYSKTKNINTKFGGTGGIVVPKGDQNADRPGSPESATLRFNTDISKLEQFDGANWISIDAPPIITATAPGSVEANQLGQTLVINGSNFSTGITVEFQDSQGVRTSATSVTRDSSSQLTVNVPSLSAGSYDIVVINNTGLSAVIAQGLNVDTAPVINTAPGTIGQVGLGAQLVNASGNSVAISVTDDDTFTFAVTSGSLPPGITLNANTGAITGYESSGAASTSSTTYNFTITVTDSDGSDSDAAYSIIQNPDPTISNISPQYVNTGMSITVTGTNFVNYNNSNYSLSIGGVACTNVTRVSDTQLTATVGNISGQTDGANMPVILTRGDGGDVTTSSVAYKSNGVTWTDTAGTLTTYWAGDSVNESFNASTNVPGGITYSVQSGSIPSGTSISGNSITGTATNTFIGTATNSFTLRASNASGEFVEKTFSIPVNMIARVATISSNQSNTDYQVKITVPFRSGMRSDFLDTRFYQGTTNLSFYRETVSSGSSAVFWVKVPTLNNGNTTINVYADGSTSTDASDPDNTFMLWQKFSGTSTPSGWAIRRASWTFNGSVAQATSWGGGDSAEADLVYDVGAAYNWTDYSLEYDIRTTNGGTDYPGCAVRVSDSSTGNTTQWWIEGYTTASPATMRPFTNNTDHGWAYTFDSGYSSWGTNWNRQRVDVVGTNLRFYNTGFTANPQNQINTNLTQRLNTTVTSNHYNVLRGTIALNNHGGYTEGPIQWDNVVVRKMQATDPSPVTAS